MPNPRTGQYGTEATDSIEVEHLSVIPKGNGLAMLVRGTGPDGNWESIEKPVGDTLVKPIGYFWEHAKTGESIPDEEFPPLPIQEAMGRFWYLRLLRKARDKDIIKEARIAHPEWPIHTRQHMNKLADDYQASQPGLPPIPKRKDRHTPIATKSVAKRCNK
jgi:hypothetical protein